MNEQSEKKIVVDADWKSQVEAEREALRRREEEQAREAYLKRRAERSPDRPPLPEPSISFVVTSLAAQAMAALGQTALDDEEPRVQPDLAKLFIDSLQILEEKTRGNLSDDEAHLLASLLHELRMAWLSAK